jgi:hypothetical protein
MGLTPKLLARLDEPFTNHSAPKYSMANPSRQNSTFNVIVADSIQQSIPYVD